LPDCNPSESVVRRASPFRRDHGGSQRALRGALLPEGRTLMGSADALKHLTGDAQRGFLCHDPLYVEFRLGVEFLVLGAQSLECADTAPLRWASNTL
jgi:hypothetical protein